MLSTSTPTELTQITAVYPSSDVLPANLLRLYIHFSQPMRQGDALHHIRLLDESGAILPDVFLDAEELWNVESTRLTVLFDPDRVKTGLRAHQQLGRALIENCRYRLEIGSNWLDANGNFLRSQFNKEFSVNAADMMPLNLANWQIETPLAGSHTSLKIALPKILDRVSLMTLIRVVNSDQQLVRGSVEIRNYETIWQFTPDSSWQSRSYQLQVAPWMEDVAGNNFYEVFDRPFSQSLNLALPKILTQEFVVQ